MTNLQNLMSGFGSIEFKEPVKKKKPHGTTKANEILSGARVLCMTGSVGNLTRTQLNERLKKRGIKFSATVTKNVNALIVGNAKNGQPIGASTKIKKAREKQIPIVSAKTFLEFFEELFEEM